MLCRVAESLFWMSRYLERAENTVRLVDITAQTLLESEHATDEIAFRYWKPVLQSLGDLPLYEKLHPVASTKTVTDFLIFQEENPSSIFSAVAAARENARMIRDQISSEMWEVINRLYLFLKQKKGSLGASEHAYFFQTIKEYCQMYQGVIESSFPRQIEYDFLAIGKFIERADKTGRILDSKHFMDLNSTSPNNALSMAQWTAVLGGCSAIEAYHQIYITDVTAENVIDFLLLSSEFPRSILFCVYELQHAMHRVSGNPLYEPGNKAENICAQVTTRLETCDPATLVAEKNTHQFLFSIGRYLSEIAIALNEIYMLTKIVDPVEEMQNQ